MFKSNGSENTIMQIQLLLLLTLYEVCRSTVCMRACVCLCACVGEVWP